MYHKFPFIFIIVILYSQCTGPKKEYLFFDTVVVTENRNAKLSDSLVKNWQHKDIIEDTIPGISLAKAYKQLLADQIGKEAIVATLDTRIDIHHEDLKKQIWTNTKETPNNGIDDDDNGYIDDIHGWNFLGNANGENVTSFHYSYVRYINAYKNQFDKSLMDTFSKEYAEYHRAMETHKKELKNVKRKLALAKKVIEKYKDSKAKLKAYVPNGNYTLETLSKIDTVGNGLRTYVDNLAVLLKNGYTESHMYDALETRKRRIHKHLNLEYKERTKIGDNPDNLADTVYGNNNVSADIDQFTHGTRVAGLIAATRNNGIGIDGISNNIKIMPVCISPLGDEHDKDIALGIRYAVDNGAKVINMSFGKTFSLHKKWVFDAIQYAADHDVLVVSSAGNGKLNLEVENNYYPNDNENNGEEIANTFILVGAISYDIDKGLLPRFSNYGRRDVDLFAPGHKVYTTKPNNQYRRDSGTSLSAAIVSGVAGMIRSYYPDLSAVQVKEILMHSGTLYNITVEVKEKEVEKMVPFSELSKSGKVVNAYNALLMAKAVSKSEE